MGPLTSGVRSYSYVGGVYDYGHSWVKQWTRQRKPYNLRLGYIVNYYYDRLEGGDFGWSYSDYQLPTYELAINASYDKFKGELGERAENAVNVIQYKMALSTIQNRGMQLYRFTRALRRGRLKEAASIIGCRPTPRKRRAHDFGALWLEYSYGIKPLVNDIYTSLDILQRPPPKFRVTGYAGARVAEYYNGYYRYSWTHRTQCKHLADISVVSPNLWVANQMGLINPGSWAWEAVPFSFVVDWFANVGNVIAAFTDLAGLNIIQPITSVKTTSTEFAIYAPSAHTIKDHGFVTFKRTGGIATPTLKVRPFKGFSVARGANAIALLLVQLRG